MRRLLPLLLLVLVAAAPAPNKTPILVGNWYGERQPTSPDVFWLAHIRPDHSFEAKFRYCARNQHRDRVISGRWSETGGEWVLLTTMADGVPANFVAHYKTLSYDGRKHVYRHFETGFVFTGIRVAQAFELPSCDIVG